jgi:DNA repair protein RecO
MNILKTTGIALSSHASGEADIICNFLTFDSGKRKFIFKGLKKSKKRSLSATEPGTVSTLIYYHREDRDAYIVNDFSIEKYHHSINTDLQKIFHLYFMLESVEKTTGYDIRDEQIFKLLIAAIEVLSKTEFPSHLSAFFILHLLKNHGILSDIVSCKVCSKNIFASFTLDVIDLRPVCGKCLGDNPNGPWQRSSLLTADMREFIRDCMEKKFGAIVHFRYREKEILDLLFNYSLFIENYYHTELKSKSFIFSERYR